MGKSLISIRDLWVEYDNTTALEGVNIDIYEDDLLGIIGPNGGGKSSLVKAIMGTTTYKGHIWYDESLRRGNHYQIGYMPQVSEFDMRFPISIREVVLSGLQTEKGFFGRYSAEDKRRADELLDKMGIAELASNPIGEVSGGQMQRALLCRAIISEPKLLILDEPTNFVDNRFEYEFYNMVRQLSDKMAIVMVSHDLGTITSVVKSILCVNRSVHRHDSNILTEEQLRNYNCPIQVLSHGHIPHTVLEHHAGDCCGEKH
ncbi:MAG: ABC transporter ATP-binding protein [Alistipes sp.]|nr:ABC transporter ATP-binding protein [Alistipes sp.]MBR7097746.1 ABC transporter ATP-binding protein [Alistipes sp.]